MLEYTFIKRHDSEFSVFPLNILKEETQALLKTPKLLTKKKRVAKIDKKTRLLPNPLKRYEEERT